VNIAVVVPRYGESVIGGAETLARTIARLLAARHRVTVLTTTAVDYITWENALPAGPSDDGDVRVLRFPVARRRDAYWAALDRLLCGDVRPAEFPTLPAGRKRALQERLCGWPRGLQEEYVRWQGPDAPELLAWLAAHSHAHDRVLFFTYLYPTTYFGMERVDGERIDFFPTLHDEPVAYLPVYGACFRRARRIFFSTLEEQRLAERLHGVTPQAGQVIGYGLGEPPPRTAAIVRPHPFLLYVGRIDVQKGVSAMLRDFVRWKGEQPHSRLRLLLIGEQHVEIPAHPDIEYVGRVSEAEKVALLRQALALIHPSPFESLALVLLEAFWCATPALVFGRNDVLVQHCRASNGGLWYRDYAELAAALAWLESHPAEARELGAQGLAYVRREYSLDAYRARLAALYP
jgi:glycosyltransferase involved in cell wall biosynthesis